MTKFQITEKPAFALSALLWVVKFKPLQWLWNKTASKLKVNLWAMRNVNHEMCLWRFNIDVQKKTCERVA
jgi:hypothetical protein